MTAEVWPVTDDFVAEIGDVDLARPDDTDWLIIEEAFYRYGVLVFPDQDLDQGQHVEVARRFGDIDLSMIKEMDVQEARTPLEIADVSNLQSSGEVLNPDDRLIDFQRGNRLWHTDSSFKPVPAGASLLYIRSAPPVGGQTEFADARAAWDTLPDSLRAQIEGRIAIHSIANSRARMGFEMTERENAEYPGVPQVLVRTHRITGRKSVYVASHAGAVIGLPDHEARVLIDALLEHCTQRQFVHSHRWRVNDLVVWDNTCMLHRGRPFDDLRWPRDAQRATTRDIGPTWEQEGVAVPAEWRSDVNTS